MPVRSAILSALCSSGGYKTLFPGIAGADAICFIHWLGAIITNSVINGSKNNPVRAFLNRAASFLNIPCICINMVVQEEKLAGLFIGDSEESWERAADLSAKRHIKYLDKSYETILGVAPDFYTDLWVAGKIMYKLESIVADGGELIIYAPQVKTFSQTFHPLIENVGYHVRDYFLQQMDRFSEIPKMVLAHSANVRGAGRFENGVEKPRIRVTLATSIPETICMNANLEYRDPQTINIDEWEDREDEGIRVVENAGGTLFRLNQQ